MACWNSRRCVQGHKRVKTCEAMHAGKDRYVGLSLRRPLPQLILTGSSASATEIVTLPIVLPFLHRSLSVASRQSQQTRFVVQGASRQALAPCPRKSLRVRSDPRIADPRCQQVLRKILGLHNSFCRRYKGDEKIIFRFFVSFILTDEFFSIKRKSSQIAYVPQLAFTCSE